ncbi:PH domain-containing protein [Lysinibacillus sphaericus]
MLKKFASDALGISDIGKIIKREDFDKTQSDDYVLSEDGEKIHFLIKSKTDEYCFTNRALIHLDGEKASSSKRNLYRYDYYKHPISNVSIETAGTIDLDLEIKFTMGSHAFSVDIDKKEGEAIADLYKSLLAISHIQDEGKRIIDSAEKSLSTARELIANNRFHDNDISDEFKQATSFAFEWFNDHYNANTRKDFGEIFNKYIQN